MRDAKAEGHVLGNFHAYYSFNPVHERLRFMDANTRIAVHRALLALSANATDDAATTAPTDASAAASATTVIDIGCNEGDLTIGLYDALAQNARPLADGATTTAAAASAVPAPAGPNVTTNINDDDIEVDINSTTALNDFAQRHKKHLCFFVSDAPENANSSSTSSSDLRKRFVCEVRTDTTVLGRGDGLSKKVAKAKAAAAALRTLQAAISSSDADAPAADGATVDAAAPSQAQLLPLTQRKPLFVFGVDIDDVLIARAQAKPVALAAGDAVAFACADVASPSFDAAVCSFLASANRPRLSAATPSQQRPFDLATLFSVTMWIHLNKGDDGLWQFLDRVSSMTTHLIVEPQPWKCYKNALRRLSRRHVEAPASFHALKVRLDVIERIDAFLLDAGRFRFKALLGKTNWSRPVVLYSRHKIPGLTYASTA